MFFDTHAHLDTPIFDVDRPEVFERARRASVTMFLNPAYDSDSSTRACAIAEAHSNVWAAVGVHPNDAESVHKSDGYLGEISKLASRPKVVAVGEIGLDYHWDKSPRTVQQEIFIDQLSLARKTHLPVIIHCRNGASPDADNALKDLLAILFARDWLDGRVILHSYAGNLDQARRAIARGYLLGIGGPLTYPKSLFTREVVVNVPLEHLVLETDAPYLPPQKWRGKRNEPSFMPAVAEKIAELRDITIDKVAATTTATALGFFGIAPIGVH